MNRFANNVVQFNTIVLGIEGREKSLLGEKELSHLTECLKEEVREFELANEQGDIIGSVDALIDLMYFAVGGLHKMGLSVDEMERCADAIHSCNMLKHRGMVERRGDGSVADATKPTDWTGPETHIARILGGEV